MSIPNQGQHSTRVAINTVTMANLVAVVTRAVTQANASCVSGAVNGTSLTINATAAMAEATLREKLVKASEQ